jgi:RNA polymerase sigma factor (sigma-70 family)
MAITGLVTRSAATHPAPQSSHDVDARQHYSGNTRAGATLVEPESLPEAPDFVLPERDALYAEFQPLVRRLIRQYGEDPELRQDLAGEIYCRFSDLLAAYDPTRGIPLRAYLVRTLTASVYTYSRSHWRRQHRELTLDAGVPENDVAQSVDPNDEWDQNLVMQGMLRELPDAIGHLPVRQRQVVVWRYYEARSFEEIAESLRIRPATARSLLRHGLNSLRRIMAKERSVWE